MLHGIGVAHIASTLFVLLWSPAPPRFCSVGYSGVIGPDAVFFVGTPSPDTVRDGAGQVEWFDAPGHFGPAVSRRPYGQRVRIERIAGPGVTPELAESSYAVVVPWDYDESCGTTLWTRSARFAPVGREVFFSPRLRERSEWVDGVPTFDAGRPQLQVYPTDLRSAFDLSARDSDLEESSVADMFTLHQVLPTTAEIEASGRGVLVELMRWARVDPGRAGRHPARTILQRTTALVDWAWARRTAAPVVGGTYALELTLPSGTTHAVFVRTAERASAPWYRGQRFLSLPESADPPWAAQVVGVRLRFWAAETADELPTDSASAAETSYAGFLSVEGSASDDGRARTWRGQLEVEDLDRALPADPEVVSLLDALSEARRAFMREERDEAVEWRPLELVEEPGGDVTLRLTVPVDSSADIEVVGRRVSSETVAGTP